jgi:D-alanyl-D-alanine carboxypeptidase (penicillin-binding protein 5/6)
LNQEDYTEYRRNKIEKMRQEKKKQARRRKKLKKMLPIAIGAAAAVFAVIAIINTVVDAGTASGGEKTPGIETVTASQAQAAKQEETASETETAPVTDKTVYSAKASKSTQNVGSDVISDHAILIDLSDNTIVAQKDAESRISPASMTKIMTVLVAAENIADTDDTFTMTQEITDFSFSHDCSNVGFSVGERIPVKDLFYGTILESGADAAVGLATYTAGSQDAFVKLMNERLKILKMSDTAHFTNCVGIYDENHYCTTYDMAMILEAAVNNPLCRQVLSEHRYTTADTSEHPDGITVSNWFLRRIEDKDSGVNVMCAKTGFVVQSKNCAASYAQDSSGKGYICVTAGSTSAWRCIYDHVAMYKDFVNGGVAAIGTDQGTDDTCSSGNTD